MVAVGIIVANKLMSIGVGWRRQSHGGGFLEAKKTIPRESSNSTKVPKKEKAPLSSKPAKFGRGKQKKKKWSKGKQKEKVNNVVLFDQGTYDKLLVEAPKYKLITPSILSDRLRVGISSDVAAVVAIKMGKGLSDRKVIVLLKKDIRYSQRFEFCICRGLCFQFASQKKGRGSHGSWGFGWFTDYIVQFQSQKS